MSDISSLVADALETDVAMPSTTHLDQVLCHHIDGSVQERCNSSALAMELHLSCTKPSVWHHQASLSGCKQSSAFICYKLAWWVCLLMTWRRKEPGHRQGITRQVLSFRFNLLQIRTLRPKNSPKFAGNIFKYILKTTNCCIFFFLHMLLNFVPVALFDKKSSLV